MQDPATNRSCGSLICGHCRFRDMASFLTVAVIATLARAVTLRDSLWLDELHTSWTVAGSLNEVVARAADGNQPPLYFWLIWFVVRMVGHQELGLRFASLLAGLLVILGLGMFVKRWTHSSALALMATVLAAIDPNFTYYAREARPYVFVQLLAIGHLHVFLCRCLASSIRTRLRWITLSWAMFFTHYTSVLIVPAELALIFWGSRRYSKRSIKWTWTLDVLICLGGSMAAIGPLRQVFGRRSNWGKFVSVNGVVEVWTIFPCFVYLVIPLLVVVVFALIGGRKATSLVRVSRRFKRFLGFFGCTFFGPVAFAWLLTWLAVAPLFLRRYVIVSSISLVVLASWWGVCLSNNRVRGWFATFSVLAVIACGHFRPAHWLHHGKEDWRTSVAFLNRQPATHEQPVFLRSGIIEDDALGEQVDVRFVSYCQFPVAGVYRLDAPSSLVVPMPSERALHTADIPTHVTWQLREVRAAVVVCRGSFEKAQRFLDRLQNVLEQVGLPVIDFRVERFAGITVWQLKLKVIENKPSLDYSVCG